MTATRQDNLIVVSGDHFRVRVDAAKGGEITAIDLFDGSDWNRVLGGDGQTCPMIRFAAADAEYRVANDARARVERFDAGPDRVKFEILATPRDSGGRESPWSVRLGYEVYPEGALFIDIDCDLPAAVEDRSQASVSLAVDRAIAGARQVSPGGRRRSWRSGGFRVGAGGVGHRSAIELHQRNPGNRRREAWPI